MAFFTPAVIASMVAAGGSLGAAGISALRSPAKQQENQDLQFQALADARNNRQNAGLVQALIDQRSVAGQTDSAGSSLVYDPGSNTWVSKLGPLPQAAQTATEQAGISRNTTDLRMAQAANEQAALRASRGGPAADAAQRELAGFRPMGSDQLTGLLGQQATNASNATFRPLVADTLRQFARTGTAAGPVLGQIGRDQAANLRDSLIDAQIKGMGGTDQINQSRRQGLAQNAADTATLASPQFQYSGIAAPGTDNTMSQVVASRANAGATAPAYGLSALNTASKQASDAAGVAGANIADPNVGLNAASKGLTDLSTIFGKGGAGNDLLNAIMSGKSQSPIGSAVRKDPQMGNAMFGPAQDNTGTGF